MGKPSYEFERIKEHIGHKIECGCYTDADGEIVNVAIECMDCCEVLVDYDKYEEE